MSLQGRTHEVMTGVWIIEIDGAGNAVKEDGFTDVTIVDFWAFSEDEVVAPGPSCSVACGVLQIRD